MRETILERHLLGGLRLAARKQASTELAILRDFVPRRLVVPLEPNLAAPSEPCVAVGEQVLRGQPIATSGYKPSTAIHAATSGRVVTIEPRPVAGPPATLGTCIVIEADGKDRPVKLDPLAAQRLSAQAALQRIAEAGIVGLGGALFPTADKLSASAAEHTLILNGAECEPYISCDDLLMREQAEEVLRGAALMCDLSGAVRCIVAIERDKPRAIRAIATAMEEQQDGRFELAQVPTVYPAGGERQLIQLLAGLEVPAGRYPTDFSFLCQNVGTAVALARLYDRGEPLTSRIVTVTGDGVQQPRNVEVRIGTPIDELMARLGGYRPDVSRLIMGGSMMGVALDTDAIPVTKATNCIVAATAAEVYTAGPEVPCIRCGDCARVCPARLLPQELIRSLRETNLDAVARSGLTDCIECGCCDVVCPSHIPLTQAFRKGKHTLATWLAEQVAAERAQDRFSRREARRRATATAQSLERDALQAAVRGDGDARRLAIKEVVERARRRDANKQRCRD